MVVLLSFIVGLITSLANSFVCMHLWNWFFFGHLTNFHMSFLLMWGVIVTIRQFRGFSIDLEKVRKTEWEEIIETNVTHILLYGMALLTGYLIHLFL